jgi:hypothetical protein
MKRSILAVAAVLALGSASVYAQTAGVQPSFNDAPDLTPIPITGTQMVDQHLPKGSFNSGGPRGPATMIVQGNQSNASYANSGVDGTRSDASSGASSSRGFGAGSVAHEPAETLNDSFHYPAY